MMNCQRICPFYGSSIELCDVGYGYISSHHVEVMIRYCTAHYEDCGKHQELATRELHGASAGEQGAEAGVLTGPTSTGGLTFPLKLEREVATIVQHEIRTPLTSIRSFAEILLDYPVNDPDARREFLRIIHEEAERLSRTVDRLFGKADAMKPARKPAASSPKVRSLNPAEA